MLKVILPNKTKHSFDYNLDASIKEVLINFCSKRGLLPDIYEVYDPKNSLVIDDSRSPRFYNINKLYLRRVNETKGSANDCLETPTFMGIPSSPFPSSDLSSKSPNDSKYSNDSRDGRSEDKQKKTHFWNKTNKKSSESIQKTDSLSTTLTSSKTMPTKEKKLQNSKTDANKYDKLKASVSHVEDVKKKRRAPLPPITVNLIGIAFNDYPDFDIPSPPPAYELEDEQFQSLPWLIDKSINTDEGSETDDSIHSYHSENKSPPSIGLTQRIKTPICTSSDCFGKTSIHSRTRDESVSLSSDSSSIHSVLKEMYFTEENISDPEEHVYSSIQKDSPIKSSLNVELSKPTILRNDDNEVICKDNDREINENKRSSVHRVNDTPFATLNMPPVVVDSYDQVDGNLSPMPVSAMSNLDIFLNTNFSEKYSGKNVLDGSVISESTIMDEKSDSETSSIGSPSPNKNATKKEPQKPIITIQKPIYNIISYQTNPVKPMILHKKPQRKTNENISKEWDAINSPQLEDSTTEKEQKDPILLVKKAQERNENKRSSFDIVNDTPFQSLNMPPAIVDSYDQVDGTGLDDDTKAEVQAAIKSQDLIREEPKHIITANQTHSDIYNEHNDRATLTSQALNNDSHISLSSTDSLLKRPLRKVSKSQPKFLYFTAK